MWIEAACFGSYVLAATVGLIRFSRLRNFLAQTPCILNESRIAQYRKLTRNQIGLLYTGTAFLLAGILTGAVTMIRHGVSGLIAMVLVNGMVLGIGFRLRSLEKKVRGIPSGSDSLSVEYQRVTETWAKNMLS